MFAVVHRRDNASALSDDPPVHCYAGKQIVLTYISRQALEDYFRIPCDERITLAQWNLVVDRNLDAFKRIIEAKFFVTTGRFTMRAARAIQSCSSRSRICSTAAKISPLRC
jgi:hypothetical protein